MILDWTVSVLQTEECSQEQSLNTLLGNLPCSHLSDEEMRPLLCYDRAGGSSGLLQVNTERAAGSGSTEHTCQPAPIPGEEMHVLEKANGLSSARCGSQGFGLTTMTFFPNFSWAPPQVENFTPHPHPPSPGWRAFITTVEDGVPTTVIKSSCLLGSPASALLCSAIRGEASSKQRWPGEAGVGILELTIWDHQVGQLRLVQPNINYFKKKAPP